MNTHKIINSLSWICFKIKIIKDKRNANGINFGAKPKRFREEYLKYTIIGYPLSTIKSKKFTALIVSAITDKLRIIVKKLLKSLLKILINFVLKRVIICI